MGFVTVGAFLRLFGHAGQYLNAGKWFRIKRAGIVGA
jgi:hypothetical protein